MAEENKEQAPEQEPVQEEEPAQEAEEASQQEEPKEEEKKESLLMPILYALLAGVGAFTLVMIIGIVVTFLNQPSEDPAEDPSAQVTLSDSSDQTETQAPEDSDGEDSGGGTETQAPQDSDGDGDSTDAVDAQE